MHYYRKVSLAVILVLAFSASNLAQSTEFNYQGSLREGPGAANGNYDFEFALFDAVIGGSQAGVTQTRLGVVVTDGVFSVGLDFGAVFPGVARYLELRTRPSGVSAFITLLPRQLLSSSPYSIKSLTADNSTTAVSAVTANSATTAQTAINFSGSLAGDLTGTQNATIVERIQSRNVANTAPANGQVLKYNSMSSRWEPATDETGSGGAGTITGVTAGVGLSGGGASGLVTLAIANGGVATAQIADSSVTDAKIVNVSGTKVSGTVANSNQLGGTAANQFVQTNDPRLFDSRTPTPGSTDYIQNRNTTQGATNFNISGNGTVGGTLAGDVVRAATQFNIGGARILGIAGSGNLFAGVGAGGINTGSSNAFFGSVAGFTNTTGSNNTLLGAGADVGIGNLSNATAVGAQSQVDCSGCLVLGRTGANTPNVGIGTAAPVAKLEIVGSNNTTPHVFATSYGSINSAIIGRQADGTSTSPSATSSGRTLLFLGGRGFSGGQFASVSRVGIGFEASQDWTETATGTQIVFDTTNNGTSTRSERMRIDHAGRVGIGTNSPFFRLDVDGTTNASSYAISGTTVLRSVANSNNLIVGPNSVNLQASSNNNTFLGDLAGGAANMTGDFNTALGSNTLINGGLSYATAVGAGVQMSVSNRVQLGRFGSDTVAVGELAAATATPLCVTVFNVLAACSSSGRYKENIRPFTAGLDLISKLRPVTYDWIDRKEADIGLIAEEVENIEPLLATYNRKGELQGVKYDQIGVILVNAVKEQQDQIALLQRRIDEQALIIGALRTALCSANNGLALCREKK